MDSTNKSPLEEVQSRTVNLKIGATHYEALKEWSLERLGTVNLTGILRLIVITPKTQAALKDLKDANVHLQGDLAVSNLTLDNTKRMTATQRIVELSEAQSLADVNKFTVLYEPLQTASAGSPLELLNLVRPGLGTIAARLSQASRPAVAAPRWVVPGFVKPGSTEAGVSYSWVNLNTNEVQTFSVVGQ
jgi:hypothetical protein